MGVQNLWLLLTPAAQKIPESQLASKRLAIDISIWVLHILHGYISLGSSNFEHIHLLAIFKRLLKLLSLGIKPIFVFDGKVPDLKKRTVAERAGSRKINLKKLAEKLIVKQLEGKTIGKIGLKKEEDLENEEMEYEEEEIEQPKDILQAFEEDLEKEGIRGLLNEKGMSFEEYESLDYVKQRELVRDLKQKALEKKQERMKSIENKAEFSKVQMQEYLKLVEKKKEIEERKKELGEKITQEIVRENMPKIEGVGGLQLGAKIEVNKDFLIVKKTQDPEIERLRNLMGKIQKPERKYKRDKMKECGEKLNKIIESKENEEWQKKLEEEKNVIENGKNMEKEQKKKENQQKKEENEVKNEGNQAFIEKIEKNPEKQEFMRPLNKKVAENDFFSNGIELKKLETLRKEFHEEEVRKMVSSHQSRSSSKSSHQKNASMTLSQSKSPMNLDSQQFPNKSPLKIIEPHILTQEEILQEIEKMDSLNPNEEIIDEEMTNDFLRLSNLNTLTDSLTTKFEQIKNLLQLFGVPWVESPFEAEAQCAYLELKGLIDGIITEDSDVFLFGGRKIYRKLFAGNNNQADLYDMNDIEKNMGLNREKMISLALFLGSDYTLGVKGIGIVNAMEIVNAFETIESLERFKAWAEKPDILLEDSEAFYRNIPLKELQYKHFHKNYKKNWEFPEEFPDFQVIEAYQKPVVDDSLEPFVWNEPDIENLKEFCKEMFEWDKVRIDEAGLELGKIVKRMRENKGQKKIEDFFQGKTVGIVKSRRLQAAIKGMKREEEKEEQEKIKQEIEELEDLNMFKFKRTKN